MPRKIETLNTSEFMDLLRDYGIPCSYHSVVAHIEAGTFPFARCARTAPDGEIGKRDFLIFKREAVEWLEARCGA
jgi:hypothetical protein